MVGPALESLPLQERLQLEVGPGFKHPWIVGRARGAFGNQHDNAAEGENSARGGSLQSVEIQSVDRPLGPVAMESSMPEA